MSNVFANSLPSRRRRQGGPRVGDPANAFAEAEELRLDARGVSLRVVSWGNPQAPALILLHGFTGSAASMAGVAEAFSATYRVHALELVGHGESESPQDPAFYSMERCVEQVLAVLDALEIQRAQFLGYSMGARVALCLAVAAPDRVASLVLIGVSPGFADPRNRAERVEADWALADRILELGLEEFVDYWMALPLFGSQKRLGARALAQARTQRLASNPVGLANSLRGMGSGAMPPLVDSLPGVDLPVLLVAGREDVKFSAIANSLLLRFPQAELLEIADAGHAAHLEQPQAFQAGCANFLASVLGPSPIADS